MAKKKKKGMSQKSKQVLKFAGTLVLYAIAYGLVFNYAFWAVFHVAFTWYTFPGWGLFFYLLKTELVPLISTIFIIIRRSFAGR